jgi:uncharacterized protein (TIGR03000 family)
MFSVVRASAVSGVLLLAVMSVPTAADARPGPGGAGGGRGSAGPGGAGPAGGYFAGGGAGHNPPGFGGAYGGYAGRNGYFGGDAYGGRNGAFNGYLGYGAPPGGLGYLGYGAPPTTTLPGQGTYVGNGGYPPGQGYNPWQYGYPGPNPGFNGAAGGMAGTYQGYNPGYNPYVIIPYSTGGYSQQGPGGYSYSPYGQPPNASAPTRRFAPANADYLYGEEGSVSYYATPSGNETPPPDASADTRNYYSPGSNNYAPEMPPPYPPAAPVRPARVIVRVPPEAHLWFEGTETKQSGGERTFKSTPLEPGQPYLYDVKARWWQDGKAVEKTRTIYVQAGQVTRLDFTTAH